MRLLDLTLPTPAENLALDEALLDEAEAAVCPLETLRFWESARAMVVIGRSSKRAVEVNERACSEAAIPIFRRASGGAAIVAGPGCLMYALVLSYRLRPAIRLIEEAHRFVLGTLARALAPLTPQCIRHTPCAVADGTRSVPNTALRCRGISDLAWGDRKVSGNSVRAKREHLLYHGTLLYDFPLELVGRYLAMPPREPAYRGARPHDAFLANLPLRPDAIRAALASAWQANEPCADWPAERTAQLMAQRYGRPEWHEQL